MPRAASQDPFKESKLLSIHNNTKTQLIAFSTLTLMCVQCSFIEAMNV